MIAGWVLCILSAITPLVARRSAASGRRSAGSLRVDVALAERCSASARHRRALARAGPASGGAAQRALATPASGGSRSTCCSASCSAARSRSRSCAAVAARSALVEPLGYRWTAPALGSWHVDTLGARARSSCPSGCCARWRCSCCSLRPLGVARALPGRRAARRPRDGAGAAVRRILGEMRARLLGIHAASSSASACSRS